MSPCSTLSIAGQTAGHFHLAKRDPVRFVSVAILGCCRGAVVAGLQVKRGGCHCPNSLLRPHHTENSNHSPCNPDTPTASLPKTATACVGAYSSANRVGCARFLWCCFANLRDSGHCAWIVIRPHTGSPGSYQSPDVSPVENPPQTHFAAVCGSLLGYRWTWIRCC